MDFEEGREKILGLMQTVVQDPVIKNRIIELLQLSSFERRTVLNNWLVQLRLRNAPVNLLSALSYLFDDKISEEVLTLINCYKI